MEYIMKIVNNKSKEEIRDLAISGFVTETEKELMMHIYGLMWKVESLTKEISEAGAE